MVRKLLEHGWRLLAEQGGQTSVEYMLAIAFLVCGVLVGFFVLVPGLEEGFVSLTERILAMNP